METDISIVLCMLISPTPLNFGFLSSPESDDACERLLCNCDKAAIECFLHSHINSSLNSMDVSLCPSLVTGENIKEKLWDLVSSAVCRRPCSLIWILMNCILAKLICCYWLLCHTSAKKICVWVWVSVSEKYKPMVLRLLSRELGLSKVPQWEDLARGGQACQRRPVCLSCPIFCVTVRNTGGCLQYCQEDRKQATKLGRVPIILMKCKLQ